MAVRKAMDYLFSQHDIGYLDDVIPEKDKKKKEDEKTKKKKKGSIDSEIDYVSTFKRQLCIRFFSKGLKWQHFVTECTMSKASKIFCLCLISVFFLTIVLGEHCMLNFIPAPDCMCVYVCMSRIYTHTHTQL